MSEFTLSGTSSLGPATSSTSSIPEVPFPAVRPGNWSIGHYKSGQTTDRIGAELHAPGRDQQFREAVQKTLDSQSGQWLFLLVKSLIQSGLTLTLPDLKRLFELLVSLGKLLDEHKNLSFVVRENPDGSAIMEINFLPMDGVVCRTLMSLKLKGGIAHIIYHDERGRLFVESLRAD